MIDKWNELLNCIEMWLWKHVKAAEKSGSHTAVQDHPGPPTILATQGPFEQKAAGNEEKASILHITSRELKIPETLKHLSSGPGFCFFLFLSVSFRFICTAFQLWIPNFRAVFSPMSQASNLSGPRVTDLLEAHVMLLSCNSRIG